MSHLRTLIRIVLISLFLGIVIHVSPPFLGGVYYAGCGDRGMEQAWLDRIIHELQRERIHADPELREVIDYTIHRYNRIGPWDVMVMPLGGWPFTKDGYEVVGCNCPFCPGLTLDPRLMEYPIKEAASVLLHEATHDYWPFMHPYIDAKMRRLGVL